MKLGIMQPYFFPYIGYFQLIRAVDHYIFFDTTQYEKGRWMNRNRIININEGSAFITVPIEKAPLDTRLKDIRIDNSKEWRKQIIAKLDVYRKRAPYFDDVLQLVKLSLDGHCSNLADLNINSVMSVCEYLGISFKHEIYSKMGLDVPRECKGDEWALNITKALGYTTYINAPGGSVFYDREKFKKEGINLEFLCPELRSYEQKIGRFEKGLSIIDVLMFNSVCDVREMLDEYEFV